MRVSRRRFLAASLVGLATARAHDWHLLLARASATGPPPNILLVIADDFGVDACPGYPEGVEKPAMPTLESLIQQGVLFEHVWAAPTCSPTRATLLTGQYGFRTGVGWAGDRLDPATPTLHRLLDDSAPQRYAHAVIGKWHLAGRRPDFGHPAALGVGHYSGYFQGEMNDYYAWTKVEDGEARDVNGYATTVFTDDAIAWIQQQGQPWFLWLAYTAPHLPLHLPPADLYDSRALTGTAADIRSRPLGYYFAAVEALDHEVGRLLASLGPAERANTVVMVLGDNGTPARVAQAPYLPPRAKGSIYEGGIRVPLVIAGAGVTRSGVREPALVNSVDLCATLVELAGTGVTTFQDGISLVPYLQGPSAPLRDVIYSERFRTDPELVLNGPPGWTVRNDRYQLIEMDGNRKQLFDLHSDPGAEDNLLGDETARNAQVMLVDQLEARTRSLRTAAP